ncbi:tRNA-specific adenosine deaminase 2 [Anabrus simplex]|uniref:tRNA-specific adenosine deaminase 2 n=1 Tax=Anabrus simplex TaxID=316456 RepID=UPI0035A3C378
MSEWMERAFEIAEEELGEVPVGCIFVYEGRIIAESTNTVNETRNATRHAEINCVDQVLKWCKGNGLNSVDVFRKVDVVVTVEPCIMCADALHNLRVASITYACNNDRFGGLGSTLDTGEFISNPCPRKVDSNSERALQLLRQFYQGVNPNAPVPKTKKKRKEN